MATIVQPYNPWREQLALTALGNVAGDIIGDIWKTHKQNEQNRKANAFRGQLQQELGNIAQQGNISLAQPQAPEGYNSNPWASALHQSYTPLTQFDIGTSKRQPTIQDIANIADNLAATPRFSALSPEVLQGVKNSFIQMAENKRLQDLQNNYIDMFRNADNPTDMFRALAMGTATGSMPKEAMQYFSPWATAQTPQYQEVNAGDKIFATVFSPFTGSVTPKAAYNVGVNPTNKYVANASANASRYNTDTNFKAEQIKAQSTAEAARYKFMSDMLENYNKSVDNEISQLMTQLESAPDEKSAAYFQQKIDDLKAQKKQYNDAFMSSFAQGGTQTAATEKDISKSSYDDIIAKASETHGVDQDLIYAVAQIESGHKNGLTSNKGAQGIMQLIPETAKRFGVNDPWDPEQNINGGVAYLKWLLDRYGGNEEKALQAYNCGEGRVARDGTKDKNSVPAVSVQYAKNVLAIANKRRAARRNSAQTQNTPQVTATGNLNTQTQNTQPQMAKTPAQGNQDRQVFKNQDGSYITQSELDEIIADAANNGQSPQEVIQALKDRGFYYVEESISAKPFFNWPENPYIPNTSGGATPGKYRQPAKQPEQTPQVSALDSRTLTTGNMSPSYMGGIPQGQVFTAPDTSGLPVPHFGSDITQGQSTTPPFHDTYRDKNRRNLTPYINRGHDRSAYYPAWNLADFFRGINSYQNSENTARPPVSALGGNSPLSGDIRNFGEDVIPQWAVLNDPFYYTKLKYGRNWR